MSLPLAAIMELTQHRVPETMQLLETIHCRKTGQPIGTRNAADMGLFMQLHGVATRQDALSKIELATQTSLAWLQTDTAHLDKLQQIDPRGFFCYCINICLIHRHHQIMAGNKRAFLYGMDGQRAFGNSLVQAYYQSESIPEHEVREYAHLFRQFLFLNLHKSTRYKLPFSSLRVDDSWKQFYPTELETPAPILPHEVCTKEGQEWLHTNLKAHITEIVRRARLDTAFYASLTTNSQFKGALQTAHLVEALNIDMNGLTHYDIGPLERLVRIQRAMEEQRKLRKAPVGPQHTLKTTGLSGLLNKVKEQQTYTPPKTLAQLIKDQAK